MINGHLVAIWQRLQQIFRHSDAWQYLVIILAPVIAVIGIFAWNHFASAEGDNAQVLSVATTPNPKDESVQATSNEKTKEPDKVEAIKVDVSGAVNNPGLKELRLGDRVNDALNAAEGLSNQADKQYVAQALNLAQMLKDGDKIYIPTYYEVSQSLPKPTTLISRAGHSISIISGSSNVSTTQSSTSTNSNTDNSLVNINSATFDQLDGLPGIGEVYANKIIDNRPYKDKSELTSRDVLTESTYEKIQSLITF